MLHFDRNYDIVVCKVPKNEIPQRNPQSYTTDDIRKGVDGLYVALHQEGAPRNGDEVVIDNNLRKNREGNMPGNSIFCVKIVQTENFSAQ